MGKRGPLKLDERTAQRRNARQAKPGEPVKGEDIGPCPTEFKGSKGAKAAWKRMRTRMDWLLKSDFDAAYQYARLHVLLEEASAEGNLVKKVQVERMITTALTALGATPNQRIRRDIPDETPAVTPKLEKFFAPKK